MRNYKKVSECPKELARFIELVNLLPSSDIDSLFHKIEYGEISRNEAKKILHKKVFTYLLDYEPEPKDVYRFRDLVAAKHHLHFFAKLSEQYNSDFFTKISKKYGSGWEKTDWNRTDSQSSRALWLEMLSVDASNKSGVRGVGVSLVITLPDGMIKPSEREFMNIFERENIPFFRIRICPICKNIFWAKKTNSQTCGKQICIDGLANHKKKIKAETANAQKAEKERKRKEERENFKNQNFSKKEGK